MTKTLRILCVVALLGLLSAAAMADNVDTLTINYEVTAINELEITAASVTLTVSSATAGAAPNQATASTTYDITTNCAANAKKITGVINTAMPAGLTLKANATAPTGGASAGATTISDVAADLVTGVDAVAESGISLGFTLDATAAAGVVSAAAKTFTMTLADSA
jgi:hypothetical protein